MGLQPRLECTIVPPHIKSDTQHLESEFCVGSSLVASDNSMDGPRKKIEHLLSLDL